MQDPLLLLLPCTLIPVASSSIVLAAKCIGMTPQSVSDHSCLLMACKNATAWRISF
jgi:hypothetical protein